MLWVKIGLKVWRFELQGLKVDGLKLYGIKWHVTEKKHLQQKFFYLNWLLLASK